MKKKKVYCKGCAYLFLLDGIDRPLCLASAEFVNGPLRDKVNVSGSVFAEKRNKKNNCTLRQSVSLKAYALKKWMLRSDHADGTGKQVKQKTLRDYPVKQEEIISRALKKPTKKPSGKQRPTGNLAKEIAEEKGEGVLSDGVDRNEFWDSADDTE